MVIIAPYCLIRYVQDGDKTYEFLMIAPTYNLLTVRPVYRPAPNLLPVPLK